MGASARWIWSIFLFSPALERETRYFALSATAADALCPPRWESRCVEVCLGKGITRNINHVLSTVSSPPPPARRAELPKNPLLGVDAIPALPLLRPGLTNNHHKTAFHLSLRIIFSTPETRTYL